MTQAPVGLMAVGAVVMVEDAVEVVIEFFPGRYLLMIAAYPFFYHPVIIRSDGEPMTPTQLAIASAVTLLALGVITFLIHWEWRRR